MKKDALKSWNRYASSPLLESLNARLMEFITKNKTEREIVRSTVAELRSKGGRSVQDCESVQPGDIVYLNWKNRAIAVARIGNEPVTKGVNAIISHGDSPRIDLKERPLYEKDNLAFVDCQYYGGIKKYQWVNIPLALHGEAHDKDGRITPIVIGEDPSDPVFTVPDLAIHIDSEIGKRSAKEAIDAENLDGICGSVTYVSDGQEPDPLEGLKKILKEKYGLTEKGFASADLTFVPAGHARELGFDRTLIGAYALDDRICVAASYFALLGCDPIPARTAVHMAMDREETGSDGVSGADGAIFELFMLELLRAQGASCDELTLRRAIAATSVVSADVTCGRNPLYDASYVRDQQPLCGNGPVIVKVTGYRGKYDASEARGEMIAPVIAMLDEEDIPWQMGSFGIIDKAGGGTLGKYIARLGADVIDIGPALISMHSPLEIASKADFVALYDCYRVFFNKMKAVV